MIMIRNPQKSAGNSFGPYVAECFKVLGLMFLGSRCLGHV